MDRGDLSDAEWALIGPLLPSERGRWARPAGDNWRFLDGMLHVLRVGCPWRTAAIPDAMSILSLCPLNNFCLRDLAAGCALRFAFLQRKWPRLNVVLEMLDAQCTGEMSLH